jgi:hypothetical protein
MGVEVQLHAFSTSALDGLLLTPAVLLTGNIPQFTSDRKLNGPQSHLDAVKERYVSCPYWESNAGLFVIQPQA